MCQPSPIHIAVPDAFDVLCTFRVDSATFPFAYMLDDSSMSVPLDGQLEALYSAKALGLQCYVHGLYRRYTEVLPFRHFRARHTLFGCHLRLLFNHLDLLPRTHRIYVNTNGLPTCHKASAFLSQLPPRTYSHFRFAIQVSHHDLPPHFTRTMSRDDASAWIDLLRDVYRPRFPPYQSSPTALARITELARIHGASR